MRNFYSNSHVNYQTFTVNGGEYVSYEDTIIVECLQALAAAFETPYSRVSESFETEVLMGYEYSKLVAPSEYEVLVSMWEFNLWVKESIRKDGSDTQSRVFTYFNLNTGKSVVWSHTVC